MLRPFEAARSHHRNVIKFAFALPKKSRSPALPTLTLATSIRESQKNAARLVGVARDSGSPSFLCLV